MRGVASGSDTVVKLNYAPRRTTSKPQAAQSVPSTAVSFAPARAETRPGSTISVNLDVETATDRADQERQFPQLKGQFLIDRGGIVRWANIECATEGTAGVGKFPAAEEILAAARAMAGR